MIIQRIRPLANDHPGDPAFCKWSSRGTSLLQMITLRGRPLVNDHPSPWSPLPGSRFNLGDLSRTIFLFFIDVFTKQWGRQKLEHFFSKVLTKMQVAKEKVVLRDWRDQTLCKRRYLFILEGLERKHCKEIVFWKLLLQWLITIYE